ncbi:MAG: hypothetical protein PHW13_10265 [Methylococcales bacterium]|nr:hypothetical protein [Methylococcales bacterium]
MKHAISKTLLATALASMSIGGAEAHSILNGYLSAASATTGYDVFRTTCFTDNASSPVGLTDAAGNQWTLPFINASGTPNVTSQIVFALSKVGSTAYPANTNADAITATVAYGDAGNVSCNTSGNTNASGQPNLDSDCTGGANLNNILSALDGTVEATTISSTHTSLEWESVASNPDLQPPISGTKLLSPLNGTNLKGWVWGSLQPKGIDQTGGAYTNANGEYVIIIKNQSTSNAHQYDFIGHCVDAAAASNPNATVDPTYHTGQGSGWIVNNPGTSGAYLSEGADYSQVVTDGHSH